MSACCAPCRSGGSCSSSSSRLGGLGDSDSLLDRPGIMLVSSDPSVYKPGPKGGPYFSTETGRFEVAPDPTNRDNQEFGWRGRSLGQVISDGRDRVVGGAGEFVGETVAAGVRGAVRGLFGELNLGRIALYAGGGLLLLVLLSRK